MVEISDTPLGCGHIIQGFIKLSMSYLGNKDVNYPIVLRPQGSVNSMLSHKA